MQERFFSKALAGANGDWIGGPQALLKGMNKNGTSSSVLLTLHSCAQPTHVPAGARDMHHMLSLMLLSAHRVAEDIMVCPWLMFDGLKCNCSVFQDCLSAKQTFTFQGLRSVSVSGVKGGTTATWLKGGCLACRPIYTPGAVTLAYKLLRGGDAALPASGGVANAATQAVSSSSVGAGGSDLLTSVAPATALYNATIFIDAVDIRNYTAPGSAAEKYGLINIPLSGGWGPYDYYNDGGSDYYGYYNGR